MPTTVTEARAVVALDDQRIAIEGVQAAWPTGTKFTAASIRQALGDPKVQSLVNATGFTDAQIAAGINQFIADQIAARLAQVTTQLATELAN